MEARRRGRCTGHSAERPGIPHPVCVLGSRNPGARLAHIHLLPWAVSPQQPCTPKGQNPPTKFGPGAPTAKVRYTTHCACTSGSEGTDLSLCPCSCVGVTSPSPTAGSCSGQTPMVTVSHTLFLGLGPKANDRQMAGPHLCQKRTGS